MSNSDSIDWQLTNDGQRKLHEFFLFESYGEFIEVAENENSLYLKLRRLQQNVFKEQNH